jgi:hypothetical protein
VDNEVNSAQGVPWAAAATAADAMRLNMTGSPRVMMFNSNVC